MTFLCFLLSETNLKFKMSLEVTHRYLQEESAMADFNGLYSYILTTLQMLLRQFTVQVKKTWVGMEVLPVVLVILELVAFWLLSQGRVSKLRKGNSAAEQNMVCLETRPVP